MEVMPCIATESVELQLGGPTTSGYSSPVILVSYENVVKRLKKTTCGLPRVLRSHSTCEVYALISHQLEMSHN